jgi:hypothetical protein
MYYYDVYSLRVESNIRIPEFPPADKGDVDLKILRGERFKNNKSIRDFVDSVSNEDHCNLDERIIHSKNHSISRVSKQRVIIHPFEHIKDDQIRLPLLGVVPSVVQALRGKVSLHASAVEIEGKAVGFLGDKGQGKSTLCADLVKAGHKLITDDALIISKGDDGKLKVYPGPYGIKLWPDASKRLGIPVDELNPVFNGSHRHIWRPDYARCNHEVELGCLIFLEDGNKIHSECITNKVAIKSLMENEIRFRLKMRQRKGDVQQLMGGLLDLCRDVDVQRLHRPRSTVYSDEVVKHLKAGM